MNYTMTIFDLSMYYYRLCTHSCNNCDIIVDFVPVWILEFTLKFTRDIFSSHLTRYDNKCLESYWNLKKCWIYFSLSHISNKEKNLGRKDCVTFSEYRRKKSRTYFYLTVSKFVIQRLFSFGSKNNFEGRPHQFSIILTVTKTNFVYKIISISVAKYQILFHRKIGRKSGTNQNSQFIIVP